MKRFNAKHFNPGARQALVAMILADVDLDFITPQSVASVISASTDRANTDLWVSGGSFSACLCLGGSALATTGVMTAALCLPVMGCLATGLLAYQAWAMTEGRDEELKAIKKIGGPLVGSVNNWLNQGRDPYAVAMAAQDYMDSILANDGRTEGIKLMAPGRYAPTIEDDFIDDNVGAIEDQGSSFSVEDHEDYLGDDLQADLGGDIEDQYFDDVPMKSAATMKSATAPINPLEVLDVLCANLAQTRLIMGLSQTGKTALASTIAARLIEQEYRLWYINIRAVEISPLEGLCDRSVVGDIKTDAQNRAALVKEALKMIREFPEQTRTVLIIDEASQFLTGVDMWEDLSTALAETIEEQICFGMKRRTGIILVGTIPGEISKKKAAMMANIEVLPLICDTIEFPDGSTVTMRPQDVDRIMSLGNVHESSFADLTDAFTRAIHIAGRWFPVDHLNTYKEPQFRPRTTAKVEQKIKPAVAEARPPVVEAFETPQVQTFGGNFRTQAPGTQTNPAPAYDGSRGGTTPKTTDFDDLDDFGTVATSKAPIGVKTQRSADAAVDPDQGEDDEIGYDDF